MRLTTLAATGLMLGLVALAGGRDAAALECNEKNPDICTTCEDLRKAYSGGDIKSIRQVRGRSVWTPLYAAYFKDCPELAARYLGMGVHPAVGGMEGDLLATVISWDRWEVPKRAEWVQMLVRGGARLDSPPITDRTTRQRLMQEYGQRDDIMALIKIAEDAGG